VDEGDKKYDGWDDHDQEPAEGQNAWAREKCGTVSGIAEKGLGDEAKEFEDVVLPLRA
jgi:hypothetical protein